MPVMKLMTKDELIERIKELDWSKRCKPKPPWVMDYSQLSFYTSKIVDSAGVSGLTRRNLQDVISFLAERSLTDNIHRIDCCWMELGGRSKTYTAATYIMLKESTDHNTNIDADVIDSIIELSKTIK